MAEVEEQPLERARVVEEHLEAQAQEEAVAALACPNLEVVEEAQPIKNSG